MTLRNIGLTKCILLTCVVTVSACGAATPPAPEQTSICTTSSLVPAENKEFCDVGQKIAFLPERFGNEQMPLLFVAANCDIRYGFSHTKGGAVCVFNPIDASQTKTASSPTAPENDGAVE